MLATNRVIGETSLRRIAHVIHVLLAEYQICTILHIATLEKLALFEVQIQVCQLVAEPRNLADCVIYAGHVSSIACFINIFNTNFVTKNCTRLLKTILYV